MESINTVKIAKRELRLVKLFFWVFGFTRFASEAARRAPTVAEEMRLRVKTPPRIKAAPVPSARSGFGIIPLKRFCPVSLSFLRQFYEQVECTVQSSALLWKFGEYGSMSGSGTGPDPMTNMSPRCRCLVLLKISPTSPQKTNLKEKQLGEK
ncbi:hypothetical protein TorRG33x02_280220 [Trema orientale]|uniref:Uncharacterized protein n=1 Tax=Trema orientale TaxID=63057 RepID=A0A2P5CM66_TREOI|nr:hypothetical protein TorRG33x02_280220 [Trema orientale]